MVLPAEDRGRPLVVAVAGSAELRSVRIALGVMDEAASFSETHFEIVGLGEARVAVLI